MRLFVGVYLIHGRIVSETRMDFHLIRPAIVSWVRVEVPGPIVEEEHTATVLEFCIM